MKSRVRLRRNRVETICLEPAAEKSHVGRDATVAGWGAVKYGRLRSNVLREVDVRVWNNTECGQSYGSKAPGGIVDAMMCASKPEEGKDSCLVIIFQPLPIQLFERHYVNVSRATAEVPCSTATGKATTATAARSGSCRGA